jgi:carbonic anhydrase
MPLRKLTSGYLAFQRDTYQPKRDFFRKLAQGQQPKILMIACADSRVDPAILTNAEPGDLFMVRNVANLVPPHLLDDSKHGTSAALQFAVCGLQVEHVIVLGHTRCGGIQALLTADPLLAKNNAFIFHWMQIADEARRRTLITARDRPFEEQLRVCGQESIKTSLANLLSFPWIDERVADGRLHLHGWLFDIDEGAILAYVPKDDAFQPLTMEMATLLEAG